MAVLNFQPGHDLIQVLRNKKLIRLDYNSKHPNIVVKKWYDLWFRLRQRIIREIEIIDEDTRYRFRCGTLREYSRCVKMFVKEPGTCDWMKNNIKSGEIIYDIGANIGVYTILAAKRTGAAGKVFAFEPHSANFSRLLDNIIFNNLQDTVIPCNFALHKEQGFFPFNYLSSQAGDSSSQLTSDGHAAETSFTSEISEIKYAASLDSLIASGKFPAPHHVKIDVDGNELLILHGMSKLLNSPEPPKSIQVEIDKNSIADIPDFMEAANYILTEKHFTRAVLKRKARGQDPGSIAYNAIFRHSG